MFSVVVRYGIVLYAFWSYFGNVSIGTSFFEWARHLINSSDLCVLPSFNPLTPESDQHLISPYNITHETHIEVMRIKEMITN